MLSEEWLRAIYFTKVNVKYRALTGGEIGDLPSRKIRAVLKGIIQSISPCLNQEEMDCQVCSSKVECPFFHLMVEDPHRDYKPCVISIDEGSDWKGLIRPGETHFLASPTRSYAGGHQGHEKTLSL